MLLLIVSLLLGVANGDRPASFYLVTNNGVQEIGTRRSPSDAFEPNSCLKFIIHGWTEDANRTHYVKMAEAYLNKSPCHIVRVDYSKIASQNYLLAALSAKEVGDYVGEFIAYLMEKYTIPHRNVHVIGHSLGGQVSGYVGRKVYRKTGEKIGRITGLDPARPLFETRPDNERLCQNDAEFVDIIHTDGGALGYADPHGTVDFYPNGGTATQPACKINYDKEIAELNFFHIYEMYFCSHHQSFEFFTLSIDRDIDASKCNSWNDYKSNYCNNTKILFGDRVPTDVQGIYYLDM